MILLAIRQWIQLIVFLTWFDKDGWDGKGRDVMGWAPLSLARSLARYIVSKIFFFFFSFLFLEMLISCFLSSVLRILFGGNCLD